jgi:riboflavin synthase
MFTGIIEASGKLSRLAARGDGGTLAVESPWPAAEIALGESIAVDGACLTVSAKAGAVLEFELSKETLQKTRFAHLRPGARLNLERALRLGDRMGGHIVSGHIDGLGKVAAIPGSGGAGKWSFTFDPAHGRYLVEKGSVAVNGISLTAIEVKADRFSAAIIPETLSRTALGDLAAGEAVHLEFDILAKHLEKLAKKSIGQARPNGGQEITLKMLAEKGFLD